jgi:protocatechuate 3,4-dioxygenase beta subunit
MKSGGLLAVMALALTVLAALAWWIGREPAAEASGAQAPAAEVPQPAAATPVQVDAPTSEPPASESKAPIEREARGKTAYQPAQGPTGSVLVRAVWESSGKPAVNVGVNLRRWGGPLTLLSAQARTDADGIALFEDVEVGLIEVRGDRSGYLPGEVSTGKQATIDLRLEPGLIVTGRVTDAEGRAVSQGQVWLLSAREWTELAECDASGRYRIDELPPDAKLAATARDRSPSEAREVEGAVGQSVTLDFEVGGDAASVLGQVLDPDEKPVAKAVVLLQYGESGLFRRAPPHRSALCDEEGRFALHSVPLGNCKLIVQSQYFAPATRELMVVLGERHEVIVNLEPGAELTGQITFDDQPASGAIVVVGFPLFGDSWGGAMTDHRGRYRITGLPHGLQDVRAALRTDGRQQVAWTEEIPDEELAKAKADVELVAGRAVIWNAVLEKKRD